MASDQQRNAHPSIELDAKDWLTARPGELFRVRVSAARHNRQYHAPCVVIGERAAEILSQGTTSTVIDVNVLEELV
jgi:hypothetical protein